MNIQKYCTPYKYGQAVLSGSGHKGAFDEKGVDIPFVFSLGGRYYMMYTGFDGIGYQTALAVSDDLLHWTHEAIILKRDPDSQRWDGKSVAGTWMIKESDHLYDMPRLKKIEGKYWMAYHAYPNPGYEEGAAAIGLAWCVDEDLKKWHRLEAPVLTCEDGGDWEQGGLYKACIVKKDDLWYMFYNAKDKQPRWIEQTGAACSKDLIHWQRILPDIEGSTAKSRPLLRVTPGNWDGRFVSDPYIVWDDREKKWINFYFGYENGHAQEGLAVSDDLMIWEKAKVPLLPHGNPGEIDENHAHKASIFYKDGVLYHFYCATRPNRDGDATSLYGEWRTITVAASKPWDGSGGSV